MNKNLMNNNIIIIFTNIIIKTINQMMEQAII